MKRCLLIAALLSLVCPGVLRGTDPPATDDYGYGYGYDYDYEYDYGYDTDSSNEPVNYFVGTLPDVTDQTAAAPAAPDEEVTLFNEEAACPDYANIWIDEESDLDLYYGVTRDPVTGELVPIDQAVPVGTDLDIWQENEPVSTDSSTSSETPAAASSDLGYDLDDLYEIDDAPQQPAASSSQSPYHYRNVEEYYGPYASYYYYTPPGVETDESAPADAATNDSAAAGDHQDDTTQADPSKDSTNSTKANHSTDNGTNPSNPQTDKAYAEYGRYGEYDKSGDDYNNEYSHYEDRYDKSSYGYNGQYDPNDGYGRYDVDTQDEATDDQYESYDYYEGSDEEYGEYEESESTDTTEANDSTDDPADVTPSTDTTDDYTDDYDDGYGGEYGYYDEYGEYDPYGGYDPYGNYEEYETATEETIDATDTDDESETTDTDNDTQESPTAGTTDDAGMYYTDKYQYYMGMQYDGRFDSPRPEYEAYHYNDDVYRAESAAETVEEQPVVPNGETDDSQLDLPYLPGELDDTPVTEPAPALRATRILIPFPRVLRSLYRAIEQGEPLGGIDWLEWNGQRLTLRDGNTLK